MKIIQSDKAEWASLCERGNLVDADKIKAVRNILSKVKKDGDKALKELTLQFDKTHIDSPVHILDKPVPDIDPELKKAIDLARKNIEIYHRSHIKKSIKTETSKGVECWWENRPIQNVGLYIPGGSAPLFSTLLMLAIPAKIAGCPNIIVCSPPNKEGKADPVIAYTAKILGIDRIYTVGGAQAIAAMAYGTESVLKADKIFGPGNSYVTIAKQLVQQQGIAIDLPAGPSEVLIIAGENSNPSYVAADLLSQAEHGSDSQVILLTTSERLARKVVKELDRQISDLPRRNIAERALKNSFCLILKNINECLEFNNVYAPEHLILAVDRAEGLLKKIQNAGSVFIGHLSCESAGDYASGTNHTLPTSGFARAYSGVGLSSFQKRISFQKISEEGLKNIGPTVITMAKAENLQAHANAVSIRLNKLL